MGKRNCGLPGELDVNMERTLWEMFSSVTLCGCDFSANIKKVELCSAEKEFVITMQGKRLNVTQSN